MSLTRRRHDHTDEPEAHVVDFLLANRRSPFEIDRLRAEGREYSAVFRFRVRMTPEEFQRLFETHRHTLAIEAKRRGITLPDPATFVTAESWGWR